ncbi:MAG: c-type cytochrome [Pedosphaera sp.]|nr:c-type cytochrome [Pedosphaera sp.]
MIESPDAGIHRSLRELGVVFGDGRALTELKSVVLDQKADTGSRRAALKTLVDSPAEWLVPLLTKSVRDSSLQTVALSGLLQLGDAEALELTIKHYPSVVREERPTLIAAMIRRPATALGLLEAISQGRIPRADLTPIHARHVASLKDEAVTRRLTEVWGVLRGNEAGRAATMNQVRRQVVEGNPPADLSRGRQLYNQLCFACHRLYGEGGQLGPDLTGSGRGNLEYLLENILDPNAVVPADYRNTVVTMKDGRVLSGLANTQNERTVTLRGSQEIVILDRREIESLKLTEQSLMPEGMLESLTGADRRNLLSYLMFATQVPLGTVELNRKGN